MPPPVYCPKLDNPKATYTCETRMLCYTDYHPHYAGNYTLSELLVGTTDWKISNTKYENWSFPDTEHLEYRGGYSATKGPESGEIHFKINVGNVGTVSVTGYHYGSMSQSYEFLIELNVATERLKTYTPILADWKVRL